MLQIAVCDDSPRDARRIQRAVEIQLPQAQILTFSGAEALLSRIEQGWIPVIAVLDIRMEDMDGVRLGRELNARCPECRIIFLTDYLEYATDVYDVRHCYFILKPQLARRIGPALSRALEELPRTPTLSFRENRELCLIHQDNVLYLERRLRKSFIFCSGGCHETREHAQKILDRIPEHSFCQCHQSFWVNMDRIRVMTEDVFRLDNGTEIPISRSFRKAAKAQFFAFLHRNLGISTEGAQK